MYDIIVTKRFKKDLKKIEKNSKKNELVQDCIDLLEIGGASNIPFKMKPHKLIGQYKNHWECHLQPDLLIIWLQFDEVTKEIYLVRVGSHSDLFK